MTVGAGDVLAYRTTTMGWLAPFFQTHVYTLSLGTPYRGVSPYETSPPEEGWSRHRTPRPMPSEEPMEAGPPRPLVPTFDSHAGDRDPWLVPDATGIRFAQWVVPSPP